MAAVHGAKVLGPDGEPYFQEVVSGDDGLGEALTRDREAIERLDAIIKAVNASVRLLVAIASTQGANPDGKSVELAFASEDQDLN